MDQAKIIFRSVKTSPNASSKDVRLQHCPHEFSNQTNANMYDKHVLYHVCVVYYEFSRLHISKERTIKSELEKSNASYKTFAVPIAFMDIPKDNPLEKSDKSVLRTLRFLHKSLGTPDQGRLKCSFWWRGRMSGCNRIVVSFTLPTSDAHISLLLPPDFAMRLCKMYGPLFTLATDKIEFRKKVKRERYRNLLVAWSLYEFDLKCAQLGPLNFTLKSYRQLRFLHNLGLRNDQLIEAPWIFSAPSKGLDETMQWWRSNEGLEDVHPLLLLPNSMNPIIPGRRAKGLDANLDTKQIAREKKIFVEAIRPYRTNAAFLADHLEVC